MSAATLGPVEVIGVSHGDGELHAAELLPGHQLRRHGYDEPAMDIRVSDGRRIVARCRGFRRNHSGVRGMRADHYEPLRYYLFEVVEEIGRNRVRLRQVLSWRAGL